MKESASGWKSTVPRSGYCDNSAYFYGLTLFPLGGKKGPNNTLQHDGSVISVPNFRIWLRSVLDPKLKYTTDRYQKGGLIQNP